MGAAANSLPQVTLEHAIRLLYLHKLDVQRCYLDVVKDDNNVNVNLLSILVFLMSESPTDENLETLKRQIKHVKWHDLATIEIAIDKYPSLELEKAEIITAIAALIHPIMAKKNSFIFSKANILDALTKKR